MAVIEKRLDDLATENTALKEALSAKGSGLRNHIVMGVSLALALGVVEISKDFVKDLLKGAQCKYLNLDTPECANARLALQKADETTKTPKLAGGAQEEIMTRAAKFFTISDVKCPASPTDALEMTVGLKRRNGDPSYTRATMKYVNSANGPIPESAKLVDLNDPTEVAAEYTFKEGRLYEVCLAGPVPQAPAPQPDAPAKPATAPVSGQRCPKESSTGADDKADFALNLLLTQRMDAERVECGKKKSKIIEVTESPPSPAAAPTVLQQSGAKP